MRPARVLAVLAAPTLFALSATLASPAAAQERQIRGADLPDSVEERLLAILDDADTRRLDGPATVSRADVVATDLLVLGDLSLDGTVEGDVVVVDGALSFGSGARVGGDVFVIDGRLRGDVAAGIDGSVTVYGDAADEWDDADRDDRDWDDRDDWSDGRADASFLVRPGLSYNRVEGLPIAFGPRFTTDGDNPLRLEALAIWRTEDGDFDVDGLGYDVTLEQRLPRGFYVGGGVRSVVDPIESRGLGDTENGLSSFLFHDDYRDYFERTGWSAFAGWRAPSIPLRAALTFRDEDHDALAAADPWTLTDGDDPWRLQPLVGVGELRTLTGDVVFDTHDGDRSPGWEARLAVTTGLGGALALPARTAVLEGPLPATALDEDFLTGTLDLRRFEPIGGSQLALRAVLAGSPTDERLPPQFQHALGGIGSLPGYDNFQADCGARLGSVTVSEDDETHTFFPGYGCDRMALFQAEYRGSIDLDFDWDWGDDDEWGNSDSNSDSDPDSNSNWDSDSDWHSDWHSGWDADWDWDPSWAVFFDAGQGWQTGPNPTDTGVLYDAGVGLLLGDIGVYWAVPLSDAGDGSRFFIRLGRRF